MTFPDDPIAAALAFGNALARRDYAAAYAMTASGYQQRMPLDDMRAAFEAIVPADGGPAPAVEAGHAMDDWPGKQAGDVGWVYVSIGGAVYSEAVTVVITSENGSLKVREVEFGRP
jgi:hypothetical protein